MTDRPGAIAVIAPEWDQERWAARLSALGAGRTVAVWPAPEAVDAAYAAVWQPPEGMLAQMPRLALILNLGAGVERLLADPSLPDVPIVRAVGPDLAQRMAEYVALHALLHLRGHLALAEQQRDRVWRDHPGPRADQITVGLMGLGELARACVGPLAGLGFRLAAWSRTPKTAEGIALFHGVAGLGPFLAATDILVALLPATPETEGILNSNLFGRLRRDGPLGAPALINAGRGSAQVEADILAALDEGTLGGASLDVFETEPLPAASPLWSHPRAFVTPHCAADSHPDELAEGVIRQIAAFEAGGAAALAHVVDRKVGY